MMYSSVIVFFGIWLRFEFSLFALPVDVAADVRGWERGSADVC